jgi:hypothetical protein
VSQGQVSLGLDIMYTMSDNSLKLAINKISASFHVEMPATYRRSIVHGRVTELCYAVKAAVMSGKMAYRKCLLGAGTDEECKGAAMHVSAAIPSLHEAFSKTWGIPMNPDVRAQNTLSEDVLKTKDFIHTPRYLHSKVVSDNQAHQLMTDLAGVTIMYMNIRYLNEPSRFIEDPGMISFLPWGHQYVYHVFPYAESCLSESVLRERIATVVAKKLYVWRTQTPDSPVKICAQTNKGF